MAFDDHDRENLKDDIDSDMFTLDELASIYQTTEAEIVSLAKELGCESILLDTSTDEYMYLQGA